MKPIIDFILNIDENMVVKDAYCKDVDSLRPFAETKDNWIGHNIIDIPDTKWDFLEGKLSWNGAKFDIELIKISDNDSYILAKSEDLRTRLLEGALDAISDSVQVYDSNLRAVFFNKVFREMLGVTDETSREGEKLLEVFDVDESYSTTISALKSKAAVTGRFDKYMSMTGKELKTVNAAYPVMEGDRVLGLISIERDMRTTKKMIAELMQDQDILMQNLQKEDQVQGGTKYTLRNLIGFDSAFVSALELARKMAQNDKPVLIQGETGTGKEMFAQGIHALSSRCEKNFVAVNCAAIPETLIESTLFGTVKGAFTGSTDTTGLLEEANHGTLFLDEMNSMSLSMQAKLLRVLQEGSMRRVGSSKEIPVDVRIISSCNEDPYRLIEEKKLRSDIFYRLASVVIEIPPLRNRGKDIEELTWYYIRSTPCSEPIIEIKKSFWDRLYRHTWPGNVRELFHVLDYALSVNEDGILCENDLPPYFSGKNNEARTSSRNASLDWEGKFNPDYSSGLSEMRENFEKKVISEAYIICGKNLTKTAELLKISRQNLQHYIKKYKVK